MTPTVEEVAAEIQSLLGSEDGRPFTTALAIKGYQRAYRYLRDAMLKDQIPRVIRVYEVVLATGLTIFDPVLASLDFGELIEVSERRTGTTEDFVELVEGDLSNGNASASSLGVFEWREDKLVFYGSSTTRDLRIRYYDSGNPPVTGSVGIDNSFAFLSYYGAAEVGPSKGYDDAEIQRMRVRALGRNLDGSGGLLYDLLQPMVRASQRVQRQPRPYTAGEYSWRRIRQRPVIMAPPAATGVEQVLTIIGAIDGVNDTFSLSSLPQDLDLYNNGVLQYPGVAYTLNGTIVTFLSGYIPQAGDLLRAKATI